MSDVSNHHSSRISLLGLMLVAMVITFAAGAYYLYQAGVPGNPRLNNVLRGGPGIIERSRIGLLLPHGATASTVIHYDMKAESGHKAEIYIEIVSNTANPYAGLLLGGDAGGSDVTLLPQYANSAQIIQTIRPKSSTGMPALDSIYEEQLTFFHVNLVHAARHSGGGYRTTIGLATLMRSPALAQQNERIIVSTPLSVKARVCSALDEFQDDFQLRNAGIRSIEDAHCTDVSASVFNADYLAFPAIHRCAN